MSLIFADGTELGDPTALRAIHNCRAVAKDELDTLIEKNIRTIPLTRWDPQQNLPALTQRRASLIYPKDLRNTDEASVDLLSCRMLQLDRLIAKMQDFQSHLSSDPDDYIPRKSLFLVNLEEWNAALTSTTYPTSHTVWKLEPRSNTKGSRR